MKLRYTLRGSLSILFTIAFFSCSGDKQERREIIRPVRYQQVFLAGGEHSRTLSGVSKAGTEAELSFRVGGIVKTLAVKVGEKIRKGKLLSSIDDSDARLNYEKALEALKKAESQKDNARSNLDRVKGLYENNNVSLSEYEAAKDKYASANSAYNTEKRNADLQKRELGYYKLYAPITGIITEVPIKKNEQASPGQAVVTISSEDDIEVRIGMPEAFITRVKTGEKVSVKFLSLPDKIFDGTITEVSFAAGAQSSTYPVIVRVEHPTSDIRPGMPVDVTFNFAASNGVQRQRLVVPTSAVGEDAAGNFVFTLMETEENLAIVHKKKVNVGELSNEGFEVLEGVESGELVVTAGVESLADSVKVRLLR